MSIFIRRYFVQDEKALVSSAQRGRGEAARPVEEQDYGKRLRRSGKGGQPS
jgi:hypothetical protein